MDEDKTLAVSSELEKGNQQLETLGGESIRATTAKTVADAENLAANLHNNAIALQNAALQALLNNIKHADLITMNSIDHARTVNAQSVRHESMWADRQANINEDSYVAEGMNDNKFFEDAVKKAVVRVLEDMKTTS
jgi:G3E family GTPase